MHTPETDTLETATAEAAPAPDGLGAAAKEVAERASTLARLEVELAQLEIKQKAAALGIGAVFAVAAMFVALYALGFLFATITAGLAEFMPVWLALLIVTVILVLVVALLGWLAVRSFKRGAPPVPRQAIDEAKQTTEALKH
jgi:hypothetical protein